MFWRAPCSHTSSPHNSTILNQKLSPLLVTRTRFTSPAHNNSSWSYFRSDWSQCDYERHCGYRYFVSINRRSIFISGKFTVHSCPNVKLISGQTIPFHLIAKNNGFIRIRNSNYSRKLYFKKVITRIFLRNMLLPFYQKIHNNEGYILLKCYKNHKYTFLIITQYINLQYLL